MRWMRQAFKWSGLITGCKAAHRVKRGLYNCGYCGNEVKNGEFDIDHEDPVISVDENILTGYDYNSVIERMFDADNLVLSCHPCHRKKTGSENSKRRKGKSIVKKSPQWRNNLSKALKGREFTEDWTNNLSSATSNA